MKRLNVLVILTITLVCVVTAQSKSDKLYEAFADQDGVTNLSFSKNMIDAINIDLGDEGNERNVTGDLHQIRLLSYNSQKGNLTASDFYKKAIGLLPSGYKKYEDPDDGESNIEIWLLGKKKKFSECHLFIKNEKDDQMCFVVSFYGDFKVDDLDRLKKTGENISN